MSEPVARLLAPRRKTRQILVGGVPVGGDAPISVQSMTKTDTRDVEATVSQIYEYAAAGCEMPQVPSNESHSVSCHRVEAIADLPWPAEAAPSAITPVASPV